MGQGPIIIRQSIAKTFRDEARAKTLKAHGWLGCKWIQLKAVFGFHG